MVQIQILFNDFWLDLESDLWDYFMSNSIVWCDFKVWFPMGTWWCTKCGSHELCTSIVATFEEGGFLKFCENAIGM
jgi:hypothetical protein